MYVVLMLMIILSALVLVLIFPEILGYMGLKLSPCFNPDTLAHNSITSLLTNLGHPEFEGVCYGFSLNWALAVAERKEERFYHQINLLKKHQLDLPIILEKIEQKKQRYLQLTEDEQLIETLPDLCKNICLAQDPLEYKKTYGKLVWQPDISLILKTINESSSRTRQVFYKTHTFGSRQEAIDYFNILKQSGINEDMAVVISTSDHAMGFKRSGDLWRFININDLYTQNKNKPYFEFTSQALVKELYRVSTKGPLTRRLTVNTDFIALKPDPHLSQVLQNQFPVSLIGSKATYGEKLSYFGMAAFQGDIPTVKKCIGSGWSIFTNHQLTDDSPILTAISLGRREVVKAMLSSTKHRINQQRKKDLSTLLHIACRFGGSGIVEDMLEIKGINLDLQDIEGMTPLMHACASQMMIDEKKLFELLLNKGASLTIKDKEGLTALDHANSSGNSFASKLIESRLNSDARGQVVSKFGFFQKSSLSRITEQHQVVYDRM